jgi:hypothetical protein
MVYWISVLLQIGKPMFIPVIEGLQMEKDPGKR